MEHRSETIEELAARLAPDGPDWEPPYRTQRFRARRRSGRRGL